MSWYEWMIAGALVYVALAPIAVAFVRGARLLSARTEHGEHEEGLLL